MKKEVTFAIRLAELLEEKGVSASALGRRAGIPKQSMSRYMHDANALPFVNALRIAKTLGVSLSVFDCVTVIMPSPTKPKGKPDGR